MESRSRGLPFGLSASRSSRASAAGSAFSATTAGYGRETTTTAGYGRETAARHDRFSRLSSYKSDVDVKSPGLLSSTSRDYGSSNWKLRLSLAVSGRSHHGASAERALAGGHRPADSDGRSVRSGPLSAVDDGENKRAKMAYSSRWLCPKTTSSSSSSSAASLAGSLRSGHGIRGEPPESSWRTRHFLPRPSASAAVEPPPPEPSRRPGHFLPRPSASREAETRGGRERPARIQDIASSLYPTERLTSAYAQGARPKDPSYLSCARDSAASSASAYRQVDDKIRPSSRFLKASYGRLSPEGASSPRRAEPSPPPRRDANGRRFLSAFLSSRHGRESPPGDQRADGEPAPVGRRRFPATSGGDPSPPPERREERPPGFTRRLLRRRDDPERSAAGREDDGGGDEERRGAAAPEPRPPGPGRRPEGDELPPPPTTRENLVDLMLRRRATRLEKTAGDKSPVCAVDSQEEKLRLIKERLLQEDSDEDEGDLCRICQAGEQSAAAGAATTRAAASNPLIQPCRCTGSLQYVHRDCIKRWLCSKIASGTSLEGVVHCELCKAELRLDVDNFDVRQLHRTRAQLDYDNFVSSGLYLVVLLEFFEQRFSDVLDAAGLFDLGRILPEQMDNLENSPLVGDDGRPSIDFSDLDDDLNDED
ncbi:E3 ubiquitin-protein ligase MARCHF7 [Stigmatopora argus]